MKEVEKVNGNCVTKTKQVKKIRTFCTVVQL